MKQKKSIQRDNAPGIADRPACERERLVLNDEDWEIFSEALANPPEPNAALRKAFARHGRLVGEELDCTDGG